MEHVWSLSGFAELVAPLFGVQSVANLVGGKAFQAKLCTAASGSPEANTVIPPAPVLFFCTIYDPEPTTAPIPHSEPLAGKARLSKLLVEKQYVNPVD